MKRWIPFLKSPPAVAVVRLEGMIGTGGRFGSPMLSDSAVAPMLERAFTRGRPKAVALVVNSPGGSPVQSAMIAARIRRLSAQKKVPVLAFVEDLAASGGYYIASAADEIWADAGSLIGSIGVISAGFGFAGLISRHGVERRVYTAGEAKSFLDPFLPEKPEDVARLRTLQDDIHATFIAHVRARREGKLVRDDIFNGDFWTGQRALDLGLIDGIGHLEDVLAQRYGKDVHLIWHSRRRPLLSRFGMQLGESALAAIEERAHLARFGL